VSRARRSQASGFAIRDSGFAIRDSGEAKLSIGIRESRIAIRSLLTCALLTSIVIEPPAQAADAQLGSYGRIQASADLDGGQGDAVNVVSYGTRLEKAPYMELDVLLSEEADDGARFTAVITTALQGDVFHYTGEWDADLALRNLFVGADGFTAAPIHAWAGSRMVRGDDVHLLDFWPMDDLNLVGGGFAVTPEGWTVAGSVGLNRLVGSDWQSQVYPLPVEGGVGTEDVLILDRQRAVGAVRVDRLIGEPDEALRLRFYGEGHRLPEGTRIVEELIEEALPADRGAVLGAQLSGWNSEGFFHVWYRMATGLAAFDELGLPTDGFAADDTVTAARQHRLATAGNVESERGGVMVGAYLQRHTDADEAADDVDDRWEGNVAIRPQLFVGEHVNLGLELSHQWLVPDGLNPRTDAWDVPQVTKLALLPAIQPRPGSFARPQIRLQYVATLLNDDARRWYAYQDERARYNLQHFVGVGAEWWINSANYSM